MSYIKKYLKYNLRNINTNLNTFRGGAVIGQQPMPQIVNPRLIQVRNIFQNIIARPIPNERLEQVYQIVQNLDNIIPRQNGGADIPDEEPIPDAIIGVSFITDVLRGIITYNLNNDRIMFNIPAEYNLRELSPDRISLLCITQDNTNSLQFNFVNPLPVNASYQPIRNERLSNLALKSGGQALALPLSSLLALLNIDLPSDSFYIRDIY
jgi:hypothetical protein